MIENLTKPNSIYFAHPINIYNTDLEKKLIKKINLFFPQYNLENPNQKHHQENYKFWKQKTGRGMDYYFGIILPRMEAGIGLSFEDGMWGFGVFGELEFLHDFGRPIWEIDFDGRIKPITNLNNLKVLSHEETRKRVYN